MTEGNDMTQDHTSVEPVETAPAAEAAPAPADQAAAASAVTPERVAELEAEGVRWAREILNHSPLAIRCLKSAFNADVDGQAGLQELAGNATLLYYQSDEAKEFHRAQREKRTPDAKRFPWLP